MKLYPFPFTLLPALAVAAESPVPLSPAEFIQQTEITAGFQLELVAAEPMVQEPVAIAWNDNGDLFVAEMNTYMQDIESSDERTPQSRVVLLSDENGDGMMDKRIVFADKLVLPRSIVPFRGGLLIQETGIEEVYWFKDNNGDGVADEKSLAFKVDSFGGNVEHQEGCMIHSLDNWIYTSWGKTRWKYQDGEFIAETIPRSNGQWGLTETSSGQQIFSNAAGGHGIKDFQIPIQYGFWWPSWELPEIEKYVFPISNLPDMQGGPGAIKNNALEKFTGCGGQEVFKGDNLPAELQGQTFLPEPVGRLVRRFQLDTHADGRTVAKNADPGSEFIRSRDPLFRPVNMRTGPDGNLYLVDMYRGIIQHGHWAKEGTYLREQIDKFQLDKIVSRGRIYRIVHEDFKKRETTSLENANADELITSLQSSNYWVRKRAQHLIIDQQLSQLAGQLENLATNSGASIHSRIHALWTLEGLGQVNDALLLGLLANAPADVQITAMRVAESQPSSAAINAAISKLASSADNSVVTQAALTASKIDAIDLKKIQQSIMQAQPDNHYFAELFPVLNTSGDPIIAAVVQNWRTPVSPFGVEVLSAGAETFQTICSACHGMDAKGMEPLAPSLVDSPRVKARFDLPALTLLHGLKGELDGRSYPGDQMIAMPNLDDKTIAGLVSYLRASQQCSPTEVWPNSITHLRKLENERTSPWTAEEFQQRLTKPLAIEFYQDDIPAQAIAHWKVTPAAAQALVTQNEPTSWIAEGDFSWKNSLQFHMRVPHILTEISLTLADPEQAANLRTTIQPVIPEDFTPDIIASQEGDKAVFKFPAGQPAHVLKIFSADGAAVEIMDIQLKGNINYRAQQK